MTFHLSWDRSLERPNFDSGVKPGQLAQSGLSLAPEDFLGLYMRGVAFNRKGCYEFAVEDFSKLIDLDISEEEFSDQPFQPGAFWSKRGYAYKSMGKNAEAAADFKRADELGYEEPEGWQAQPSSDENI